MARSFFDLYDGTLTRDSHGIECAGLEEIAEAAMQAVPDMVKGKIPSKVAIRRTRCWFATSATLSSTRLASRSGASGWVRTPRRSVSRSIEARRPRPNLRGPFPYCTP